MADHDVETESDEQLLGWFTELVGLVEFSSRRVGTADADMATYLIERLQIASQSVAGISDVLQGAEGVQLQAYGRLVENIIDAIHQLIAYWEAYMMTLDRQMEMMAYHAPRLYSGRRGRPKFHVTCEYLRTLSFSWSNIASLLCVSRMTIYRCRRVHGLLADGEPSTVPTDTQLKAIIRRIRSE